LGVAKTEKKKNNLLWRKSYPKTGCQSLGGQVPRIVETVKKKHKGYFRTVKKKGVPLTWVEKLAKRH